MEDERKMPEERREKGHRERERERQEVLHCTLINECESLHLCER